MAARPAAIGAARVPRTSFKTPYTSKKTSTMSAILRGSTTRLRYSVYGSSSNISCSQSYGYLMLDVATATWFLHTMRNFNYASADMFGNGPTAVDQFAARSFKKDHFDFRLGPFNAIFDLRYRFFNVARDQIRSQLHVRVN